VRPSVTLAATSVAAHVTNAELKKKTGSRGPAEFVFGDIVQIIAAMNLVAALQHGNLRCEPTLIENV
jgi:hypothetical protein